jgi:hypothetical protein
LQKKQDLAVLQTNGSGVLSFSSPSAGITEADQWRLTTDTNHTVSPADITSNLERIDTNSAGIIGTGMTQSSGIFTFPSTGIWLIQANFTGWYGAGSSYYVAGRIKTTTNNSTYSTAGISHGAIPNATNHYGFNFSILFDVTNITTHKVKFDQESASSSASMFGSTTITNTYFKFIRLGDT